MSEPIRVLELGSGVASAYAARLLGDHGADVVKVEPPDGDPLRRRGPFPEGGSHSDTGGMFRALNFNKRGVTLTLERHGLQPLLGWVDVLVHDLPASRAKALGLDAASLSVSFPHLVTLALTPFGHTGPYAAYQAEELTVINAGGWANLCPATHTDADLPPLKVCGDHCAMMSAVAAAMSALAFARAARISGIGEHVDFSQQEYVASVLESGIPAYSYKGDVASRHHPRSLIPWRIFQASDAPVFIVCIEEDQWQRLVALMGNPEWASEAVFADRAGRAENQDLVHTFVQEFVSEWKAMDLYHAAQARRICVAPVMSFQELSRNEHLRERGFFVGMPEHSGDTVEYLAPPVLARGGRAPVRLPAPRLGEHNPLLETLRAPARRVAPSAPDMPLAGVRVLDMTWAWAGPFCSMNLAHLGAEVIRVESAKRADLYRRLPVHPEDWEPGLNLSGMFNQWSQGKSSLTVDLTTAEGLELVKDLVRHSDVVVQNFATGVLERLGLGYDTLRGVNPRIILASISGYGQTGPYRSYMGYGPAFAPLTGLSAGTGYLGGGPEEIGLSMPDPTAGITAALGIVSALLKRDESGEGDHLDVSLWEATGVLNVEGWMRYAMNGEEPERMGNRSTMMSPHGCFPCRGEDSWVSIACRTDGEWQALAQALDRDMESAPRVVRLADDERFRTLAGRKAHEAELEAAIAAWTVERDRWELTTRLQAAGIAAFPTMTARDLVEDAHLNQRGFIERLEHPEVGARAHGGIPWRLTHRRNGVSGPAPCLDADTDRHLRDILGLSEADIARLRRDKVVGV